MKMSLATNCEINNHAASRGKNYFYPDLPKGYQISQYAYSAFKHGSIILDMNGEQKKSALPEFIWKKTPAS